MSNPASLCLPIALQSFMGSLDDRCSILIRASLQASPTSILKENESWQSSHKSDKENVKSKAQRTFSKESTKYQRTLFSDVHKVRKDNLKISTQTVICILF